MRRGRGIQGSHGLCEPPLLGQALCRGTPAPSTARQLGVEAETSLIWGQIPACHLLTLWVWPCHLTLLNLFPHLSPHSILRGSSSSGLDAQLWPWGHLCGQWRPHKLLPPPQPLVLQLFPSWSQLLCVSGFWCMLSVIFWSWIGDAGTGRVSWWVRGVEGRRRIGPHGHQASRCVVSKRQSDVLYRGENLLRGCLPYLVMLKKKKNLFLSFKSQKKTPLGTLVLGVRAGLSHGAVIIIFIITSAVLE